MQNYKIGLDCRLIFSGSHPGMLGWSSNILIIFIVNSKIALVFETELQMKNRC